MAYESNLNCVSLEAGQDLSAKQYYFVTVASDGQVDPTGDGLEADGVLQDTPSAAGQAAQVAISGITKVACGGTVTKGGDVGSDSAGKAVDAATGDYILGVALETGASGSIIAMLLRPGARVRA